TPCFVVIATVAAVVLLYTVLIICPAVYFPLVSLLLVLSFSGFLSSQPASTLPLPLVASTVHLVLLPSPSMMFVTISSL
ncbi:MAG: hypothetical protein MPK75_10555, partial [Alphaproteobacteria bacterium]|nr:hypothetical protein [Alphaproteobacteria bacterium]